MSAVAATLEREADFYLPYLAHLDEHVIALDTGARMCSWRVAGIAFATRDVDDINALHTQLNDAWRAIAHERLALWIHTVRRPIAPPGDAAMGVGFAADLHAAHIERLKGQRLFRTDLFITLVVAPPRRGATFSGLFDRTLRRDRVKAEDDQKLLGDKGLLLERLLERYGLLPLGLRENAGLIFSEPLELLTLLLTGEERPMPLVRGHMGRAACVVRPIFGRETIELRSAGGRRYAAILSAKEYPARTIPGQWNALLSAPFAFIASQSFAFLSKAAARTILERKQNQLVSAMDRAASQIDQLDDAVDDLISGRWVMGEHHVSVAVFADTVAELEHHMADAVRELADGAMIVAREDIALMSAFWAQFPGNFGRRVRPAAITSRNFAALAPLHSFPAGRASGNHWGSPVAFLTTEADSAFHFSFHEGDVGHTFLVGPTGSGKTVLQNFLLAEAEKLQPRQIVFDKDRGAELFVRAMGGTYLQLRTGEPTGCAPLQALDLQDPGDRAALVRLVRVLVEGATALRAADLSRIEEAVDALSHIAPQDRSFAALRAMLGQGDSEGIGARLARWCQGGALGWVFDNPRDLLGFDQAMLGIDVTQFLDDRETRTPLMMYLFHRIDRMLDGTRTIVTVDEAWKALDDEAFRAFARDGMKTWRKRNALLFMGTQQPSDMLRSPIAPALIENCATRIFMPNPAASDADYARGFGLRQAELEAVRRLSPARREVLVCQGNGSVILRLDLASLDDQIAILSGRADSIALADRLRAELGDRSDWMTRFHQERRRLG